MTNILEKIREWILIQMQDVKVSAGMKISIGCIVAFVVFTFIVYVSAWFILFGATGQVPTRLQLLSEWRSFITLLFSGGFTTAVLFYLKLSVDKNKNGVPDVLEEDEERNKRPPLLK